MSLNSKVTAIIATATAPVEFFIQSILSLLLRTPSDVLDQVIVSINGPDSRTGETLWQDQKEEFSKELAKLGYPVTIVRTWSRLDPSRPFQMCLPLIKTKYYVIVQDDLIVTNPHWFTDSIQKFERGNSIVMSGKRIARRIHAHFPNQELSQIDFFAMNMAFVMVNAEVCYDNWTSYINIPNASINNYDEFKEYHINAENFDWKYYNMFRYPDHTDRLPHLKTYLEKDLVEHPKVYASVPIKDHTYTYANMPMGAWVYYYTRGKIDVFNPKTIYHFCEGTTKENTLQDATTSSCELKFLEDEISLNKTLEEFYFKWIPARKNRKIRLPQVVSIHRGGDGNYPSVLISVCVYKKIHVVEKWMKHWYTRYNRYNSKVALIHNFNGEEPDPGDKARLLSLNPDYYVPRYNRGQDIGIFQDLVEKRLPYFQPEFDLLFCLADDTYPLHKDFLRVFMAVMEDKKVGLCPPYTFYTTVRSNAFGISRDVAENLEFPHDPIITKIHCYQVETEMPQQVVEMGLRVYQLPTAYGDFAIAGPFANHQWLVWDDDWLTYDVEKFLGQDYGTVELHGKEYKYGDDYDTKGWWNDPNLPSGWKVE